MNEAQNISKSFIQNNGEIQELFSNVSFSVQKNETVAIVGQSGSGKSSLLYLMAGLDSVTSGVVLFDKQDLSRLSESRLCQLRNKKMGFIYQFHHLLAECNVFENITMPIIISGEIYQQEYFDYIVTQLGLSKKLESFPHQLSGGERQRVAIARAFINKPDIVFADEPTGNLDNFTSDKIINMILDLQKQLLISIVIVTHDKKISDKMNNVYSLHNGKLEI